MTEIAQAGGALAIRPDQTIWTAEQNAVLRQSGIGESVTNAELAGFLHLCQRTGLDPFSRQIYLIGRYDKKAGREVFTPQTGIDGYRVIAQRVTSQTAGTYGYEDTLWCDSSGRWRDVWLSDEPPAAAKVTVVRNGARFSAVARFSEYAQTFRDGNLMGLWAKMPAGQIAKCCEALALRKAFPHDLAGVYTAEEMAQADNPAPVAEQAGPVQRAKQASANDPWATPAPAADSPPVGSDLLAEALAATHANAVRELYRRAAAMGAPQDVLARLAEVGRRLAEQTAPAPEQAPGAPAGDDGVIDVDVVGEPGAPPLPSEREQVLTALHAVAARHGVSETDLDRYAADGYGRPVAELTVSEVRSMTQVMERAA